MGELEHAGRETAAAPAYGDADVLDGLPGGQVGCGDVERDLEGLPAGSSAIRGVGAEVYGGVRARIEAEEHAVVGGLRAAHAAADVVGGETHVAVVAAVAVVRVEVAAPVEVVGVDGSVVGAVARLACVQGGVPLVAPSDVLAHVEDVVAVDVLGPQLAGAVRVLGYAAQAEVDEVFGVVSHHDHFQDCALREVHAGDREWVDDRYLLGGGRGAEVVLDVQDLLGVVGPGLGVRVDVQDFDALGGPAPVEVGSGRPAVASGIGRHRARVARVGGDLPGLPGGGGAGLLLDALHVVDEGVAVEVGVLAALRVFAGEAGLQLGQQADVLELDVVVVDQQAAGQVGDVRHGLGLGPGLVEQSRAQGDVLGEVVGDAPAQERGVRDPSQWRDLIADVHPGVGPDAVRVEEGDEARVVVDEVVHVAVELDAVEHDALALRHDGRLEEEGLEAVVVLHVDDALGDGGRGVDVRIRRGRVAQDREGLDQAEDAVGEVHPHGVGVLLDRVERGAHLHALLVEDLEDEVALAVVRHDLGLAEVVDGLELPVVAEFLGAGRAGDDLEGDVRGGFDEDGELLSRGGQDRARDVRVLDPREFRREFLGEIGAGAVHEVQGHGVLGLQGVAEGDDAVAVIHGVVGARGEPDPHVRGHGRGPHAEVEGRESRLVDVGRAGVHLAEPDQLRAGPDGQADLGRRRRQEGGEGEVVILAPGVGGVEQVGGHELGVADELPELAGALGAAGDEGGLEALVLDVRPDAEELLVVGDEFRGGQGEVDVAEGDVLDHLVGVALIDDGDVLMVDLGVVVVHVHRDLGTHLALHAQLHLLLDVPHVGGHGAAGQALVMQVALFREVEPDDLTARDGEAHLLGRNLQLRRGRQEARGRGDRELLGLLAQERRGFAGGQALLDVGARLGEALLAVAEGLEALHEVEELVRGLGRDHGRGRRLQGFEDVLGVRPVHEQERLGSRDDDDGGLGFGREGAHHLLRRGENALLFWGRRALARRLLGEIRVPRRGELGEGRITRRRER